MFVWKIRQKIIVKSKKKYMFAIISITVMVLIAITLFSASSEDILTSMPELDGDYSYVCIKIVEIDIENFIIWGEVIGFEDVSLSGVNVGLLSYGSVGLIDISGMNGPFYSFFKLMTEGQIYVVSYVDRGQTDFPIEAVSFENMISFRERVSELSQ